MNVAANTTLIFTTYLVGAYDVNQYFTGHKSDLNAGYLEGVRYVKSGTSDADMELWPGWNVHIWDSNFWLQGTLIIIPVELTSFKANVSESNVVLEWTTATETNNMSFEIQRRNEDSKYQKIGYVPGHGTTIQIQNYSYVDSKVLSGNYFYRLKQIDFLGTYEYSDEIEVEVNGPLTFVLEQSYPNPFNPSTLIKYSVPKNGFVKLSVYNLVGEEVNLLVSGQVDAGFYEIEFDATSLPSGIYFYRLQAGNKVETKKMILLK